ncbi:MAG: hypothetical protein U0T83_00740 [Bacteriovoracaceae bacterium]
MYFGEFLLKTKLITKEQLLDALIYQLDYMPSLLSVLRENKLLNDEDILKLVNFQIEENIDLITAIKKLKLLDKDKIDLLLFKQSDKRIPIGQILIMKGALTLNSLQFCLNSFMQLSKENKLNDKNIKSFMQENFDASLNDFNFVNKPLNTKALNEYLVNFDEDLYNLLVDSIESLQTKGKNVDKYSKALFQQFNFLKMNAKSLNAQIQESLLDKVEKNIQNVQHSKIINKKITSLYLDVLELLWELRKYVSINASEYELWEDEKFRDLFIKIYNKL